MTIVYEESKKFLKNIISMSQYVMKIDPTFEDYKLITILGEHHTNEYKCGEFTDNTISIDEFILRSPDIKTNIFIESVEIFKDNVYSYNIQNILKKIRNSNPDETKNISTNYIEHRHLFLDANYYHWLYIDINKIINLSNNVIIEQYINPFYDKISSLSKYNEDEAYYPLVNIMYDNYLPSIENVFKNLLNIIIKKWDTIDIEGRKKIIFDLQSVWGSVQDFYIIRDIFKVNDIKEYIILIGDAHIFNINNYFQKVLCAPIKLNTYFCSYTNLRLTNSTKKNVFNCISLDNTLIVTNESKDKRKIDFDICKKRNDAKLFL
jgi:hypothetical protein